VTDKAATKAPKQRGRGWLLSLAAVLMWEVLLVIGLQVSPGRALTGHNLYWHLGPLLVFIALVGTPVTYLAGWRRPGSYYRLAWIALPVVLFVFFTSERSF
jgi:hypothetical protein